MNRLAFFALFVIILIFSNPALAEDQVLIIPNAAGDMGGHTPWGFAGSGRGLFVGDNLNPGFPNGEGVQAFISFDLSALPPGEIISATLRTQNAAISGNPFEDLGALNAEEIRFATFSAEIWDIDPVTNGTDCALARSIDDEFTCDVTGAIQSSIADRYGFAQFRLRMDRRSDGDGMQDLVLFFISDSNSNEPGIFELEIRIADRSEEQDTLSEGLVAHYPFDGDANDQSGNNHHGETFGAEFVEDRFGNERSAIRFDGIDNYIRIEDSSDLDLEREMSLSFWLFYEAQALPTWYTIFEKTGDHEGHARYGAWIIRDLVEICIEPAVNAPRVGPQQCLDSTQPLIENAWNHVAGTFDGNQIQIILNGEEAGALTIPRESAISENDAPIFIGTDLFAGRPLFTKMSVDEIRIYNRVLNPQEIQMLFEQEP